MRELVESLIDINEISVLTSKLDNLGISIATIQYKVTEKEFYTDYTNYFTIISGLEILELINNNLIESKKAAYLAYNNVSYFIGSRKDINEHYYYLLYNGKVTNYGLYNYLVYKNMYCINTKEEEVFKQRVTCVLTENKINTINSIECYTMPFSSSIRRIYEKFGKFKIKTIIHIEDSCIHYKEGHKNIDKELYIQKANVVGLLAENIEAHILYMENIDVLIFDIKNVANTSNNIGLLHNYSDEVITKLVKAGIFPSKFEKYIKYYMNDYINNALRIAELKDYACIKIDKDINMVDITKDKLVINPTFLYATIEQI